MSFTILLVDDSPTYANSVRKYLGMQAGIEVVGHALTGADALTLARDVDPDLVLLDIGLPDISGLEVAQAMQAWPHPPQVIFLTMQNQSAYRLAAQKVGAVDFVTKAQFVTQLVPLIEQMARTHAKAQLP